MKYSARYIGRLEADLAAAKLAAKALSGVVNRITGHGRATMGVRALIVSLENRLLSMRVTGGEIGLVCDAEDAAAKRRQAAKDRARTCACCGIQFSWAGITYHTGCAWNKQDVCSTTCAELLRQRAKA